MQNASVIASPVRKLVAAIRFPPFSMRIATPVTRSLVRNDTVGATARNGGRGKPLPCAVMASRSEAEPKDLSTVAPSIARRSLVPQKRFFAGQCPALRASARISGRDTSPSPAGTRRDVGAPCRGRPDAATQERIDPLLRLFLLFRFFRSSLRMFSPSGASTQAFLSRSQLSGSS